MPYTTTTTDKPPVPGTTVETWEGWVRADELLPCDVIVDTGAMIDALAAEGTQIIVVVGGETEGVYYPDETLYVERKVRLTVELGRT